MVLGVGKDAKGGMDWADVYSLFKGGALFEIVVHFLEECFELEGEEFWLTFDEFHVPGWEMDNSYFLEGVVLEELVDELAENEQDLDKLFGGVADDQELLVELGVEQFRF